MTNVVLDASALLALLQDEQGSEIVAEHLPDAAMSTVNLAEVVARLTDHGMSESEIRGSFHGLGIAVHPFDAEMAYATGLLRSRTRSLGLSLGDRAALALGKRLSSTVLTSDRDWRSLRLGINVRVIR